MQTQAEKSLHVCLLGDPGCGHSAFLRCYQAAYGVGAESPPASKQIESFTAMVELNGEPYRARFTDNAGAPCFERMQDAVLGTAHVVLLCFSIESEETLLSIEKRWLPTLRSSGSEAPTFVLGLRADLRKSSLGEDPRFVPEEQGVELARRQGAFGYLECSTHHPETVLHAVLESLQVAKDFYNLQWQLPPRPTADADYPDDSCADAPWLSHERLNVTDDPNALDVDTLKKNLSMIGYTPTRQHAYLRIDVASLGLTSVDELRSYPHLQFVNLSGNRLKTLEPLGLLRCLLHLNVSYNLLTRTQSFTAPDSLETCDMSYNMIGALGDWHVHRYLRELNLRGNFIDRIGSGLRNNKELRMLDISENYLSRIEGLDGLGLRTLYLAQNRLVSLEGVSTLASLQVLNVRHNNITSIAAVRAENNPRLRRLCVSDNRISRISEVEGLASFNFLCDLFLAPNPIVELPHYRAQVLHRLPRLRSLDAQAASGEEKVKADLIYGADVDMRRDIFEHLLPEETFVDRRLITEEGIASMEEEKFGIQGDAGPYGGADATAGYVRTFFQEAKFRQRLALVRSGGSPPGVADFTTFAAPFISFKVYDRDLQEILEACAEGRVEQLILVGAELTAKGVLEVLACLQEAPRTLRHVDLSSCRGVGEVARELLTGFPYGNGCSMEAVDCGLTDTEVIRLRNKTPAAEEALRRAAAERKRSADMVARYMASQPALGEFAELFRARDTPPEPPLPMYRPERWREDSVARAQAEYQKFLEANPSGLLQLDGAGHAVILKDGSSRTINEMEYCAVNQQRSNMLKEYGVVSSDDHYYFDEAEGEEEEKEVQQVGGTPLPESFEEAFSPVFQSQTLMGFMVWEGVEPAEDIVAELERQKAEWEKEWKERQAVYTNLKKAAEGLYDVQQRPQSIASGMLAAHFTSLCFSGAPRPGLSLKPPAQFRLKRLSEVPRPPPKRGIDLFDALMAGHVQLESCQGHSFGSESVVIKLRSTAHQDLEIAIRRGSIFQHIDWLHKQNLLVAIDYVINVPAGGYAWKKMESYCMNVTCACSSGETMTLTEFYFEDLDAMESQGTVWDHFQECFANSRS